MQPIASLRRLVASLRAMIGHREPRLVRRVGMVCPHGRGRAEVEILTDRARKPVAVLRCSVHTACPPTCDQSCHRCAEAVLAPAHALIIYPPGDGPVGDYVS